MSGIPLAPGQMQQADPRKPYLRAVLARLDPNTPDTPELRIKAMKIADQEYQHANPSARAPELVRKDTLAGDRTLQATGFDANREGRNAALGAEQLSGAQAGTRSKTLAGDRTLQATGFDAATHKDKLVTSSAGRVNDWQRSQAAIEASKAGTARTTQATGFDAATHKDKLVTSSAGRVNDWERSQAAIEASKAGTARTTQATGFDVNEEARRVVKGREYEETQNVNQRRGNAQAQGAEDANLRAPQKHESDMKTGESRRRHLDKRTAATGLPDPEAPARDREKEWLAGPEAEQIEQQAIEDARTTGWDDDKVRPGYLAAGAGAVERALAGDGTPENPGLRAKWRSGSPPPAGPPAEPPPAAAPTPAPTPEPDNPELDDLDKRFMGRLSVLDEEIAKERAARGGR